MFFVRSNCSSGLGTGDLLAADLADGIRPRLIYVRMRVDEGMRVWALTLKIYAQGRSC